VSLKATSGRLSLWLKPEPGLNRYDRGTAHLEHLKIRKRAAQRVCSPVSLLVEETQVAHRAVLKP
jgi:hypothetical protein